MLGSFFLVTEMQQNNHSVNKTTVNTKYNTILKGETIYLLTYFWLTVSEVWVKSHVYTLK